MAISEEQRAISLIFNHLAVEGADWYKSSGDPGVSYYSDRLKKTYSLADANALQKLRWASRAHFDRRQIALLRPPTADPAPLLAVWCRWDFEVTPARCGFYTGLWTRTGHDHTFIGFRFETPEDGEQHGFYHCQPCRNLGDRDDPESVAVEISEKVPTFALHAGNSAELALNIVLAMRGKTGLKEFRVSLFENVPEAARNRTLIDGFRRLHALPEPPPTGPINPAEI